jgi:hypothetical protein
VGLVRSEDPESYDGGSIATGRGSHARQVKGDDPDKRDTLVLLVGGWADNPTLKNLYLFRNLNWSLEKVKEEWRKKVGEATARSAIEEQDVLFYVLSLCLVELRKTMKHLRIVKIWHTANQITRHLTNIFSVCLLLAKPLHKQIHIYVSTLLKFISNKKCDQMTTHSNGIFNSGKHWDELCWLMLFWYSSILWRKLK